MRKNYPPELSIISEEKESHSLKQSYRHLDLIEFELI